MVKFPIWQRKGLGYEVLADKIRNGRWRLYVRIGFNPLFSGLKRYIRLDWAFVRAHD